MHRNATFQYLVPQVAGSYVSWGPFEKEVGDDIIFALHSSRWSDVEHSGES